MRREAWRVGDPCHRGDGGSVNFARFSSSRGDTHNDTTATALDSFRRATPVGRSCATSLYSRPLVVGRLYRASRRVIVNHKTVGVRRLSVVVRVFGSILAGIVRPRLPLAL